MRRLMDTGFSLFVRDWNSYFIIEILFLCDFSSNQIKSFLFLVADLAFNWNKGGKCGRECVGISI